MNTAKKIEYLLSLMWNTGRLIKEVSPCEGPDPMSMLQIETLRLIKEEKPTMKRISEYLRVKAPSVTPLINGMGKKGYVTKKQSTDDKRITHLIITKDGETFLVDGMQTMLLHMKKILSTLTEEQITNFIAIMEQIQNAYKK
jgi:DNA-binding MarR family transcriptional regulator